MPDAVLPTEIDETPGSRELPRDCALRLARAKAESVPADQDEVVLAADTIVALGRRLLGKPVDATQAGVYLRLLSGRRHRVVTGVALCRGKRRWNRTVETAVRFKRLDESEITGLPCLRRMAGQGRRLRDPRAGGRPHPVDRRLLLQCRWSAVGRDDRASLCGRRLSAAAVKGRQILIEPLPIWWARCGSDG